MTLPRACQHALFPLALALAACGTPPAAANTPAASVPEVRLEPVVSGLEQPTSVVNPSDGSGRLFITQKTGLARIVENGELLDAPFLDLTGVVSLESEQGLLGLAFHPDYAKNGRLFIHYNEDGDTVISEFAVSDDPNVVDAASERVLLTIEQPYPNHKGGNLAFGPDGLLYIGMGDGGAGGDPEGRGQDLTTLLGKMLRIDVDTQPDNGDPYAVPQSNPFVASGDAEPEIWAYGLRNPWKYSFDRETGDLWIADVGQGSFEEVNMQPASSTGGENYGWDVLEGSSCYSDDGSVSECAREAFALPVTEYGRDEGSSITGGYVYRGENIPALAGQYVFGDFGSGLVWTAAPAGDGSYTRATLLDAGFPVVAFGEDEAGELYVADFTGALYRFAPAAQASQ